VSRIDHYMHCSNCPGPGLQLIIAYREGHYIAH